MCKDDYVLVEKKCICLLDLNGKRCVPKCGLYQYIQDGRCTCKNGLEPKDGECVLREGVTWRQIDEICTAEDRSLSLDYSECVEKCGDNEEIDHGHCRCNYRSALSEEKNACVPSSQCDRV